MKQLLFFFIWILLNGIGIYAQDESPYALFGYEGKVLKTPQERQDFMLIIPNPRYII